MRWLWIDRIVELDAGARCVAVKNVSLAEEHLHDHFPARPVMPASLIIEGMAQTAGILVGHARGFAEKVILAKIGRATFDRDVYPGQTLFYEATLDRIDDAGAATTGAVTVMDHALRPGEGGAGERLPVGTIELMFSHIDRAMTDLDLPAHNFVFGDAFKQLLRESGFG